MSTTKEKYILIVDDDDDEDLTSLYETFLKYDGYKVDAFIDPIDALSSFKKDVYDLVILDIKMPKMDGFELYIKIKEKDPNVKICFLTAIAMFNEEFRKARSEIGRIIAEECFIQKPIKTEDLIKKLTSIMNIDIITMSI